MKIGIVQYNPSWEDKTKNREKLISMMSSFKESADVFVFPEMTLTGFTMNAAEFAESVDGDTLCFFRETAVNYKAHVFAGLIEKKDGHYFNSLVHIDDTGKLQEVYRKIHPFSYSGEDQHYSRGTQKVIAQIGEWKIGMSICYDLRFPELYRLYAIDKVNLIINIANWPDTRIEHWKTLLKARAIENQCYVIGVNRSGNDPRLYYSGCSSVYDAMGNDIVTLNDEEKITTAEIFPGKVEEVRKRLPFLDDIFLIK